MYVLINTAKIKYLPYKSKRVFQKHKKRENDLSSRIELLALSVNVFNI